MNLTAGDWFVIAAVLLFAVEMAFLCSSLRAPRTADRRAYRRSVEERKAA